MNTIIEQDRRTYIGGSDISAILGVNPYRTKLQVWLEKTGQAEPFAGNEATRWGNILEGPVAAEFAQRHNVQIALAGFRTRNGFAGAHADRMIIELLAGLEIKTAGMRSAHRWGESGDLTVIPEEYLAQCAWYMALYDLPAWWLAVLIGGQDYREYELARDSELEAAMFEAGERFWSDHVVANRAPDLDGSDAAAEYVRKRFPKNKAPERVATPEEAEILEEYLTVLSMAEGLEERKAMIENRIRELIGDASGIVAPIGKVTWTANKDSEKTDWKAVAAAMQPAAELVKANTKTVPGARVLRKAWNKATNGTNGKGE